MKNHHLFIISLVMLMGAPALALADDKPPAANRKSETKPGKPQKEGMPGHEGMPSTLDGARGHQEMRDAGTLPSMRDEPRDGGVPGRQAYQNGIRELYQDLKNGKLKKDQLQAKLTQLHDTLDERRKAHREDIGKRWGATLEKPAARNELKVHARRTAFLERALVLTQSDGKLDKDKTIDRISKLIDKENARHEKAMTRIQSVPADAVTAAPSTSAPSEASEASGGSK